MIGPRVVRYVFALTLVAASSAAAQDEAPSQLPQCRLDEPSGSVYADSRFAIRLSGDEARALRRDDDRPSAPQRQPVASDRPNRYAVLRVSICNSERSYVDCAHRTRFERVLDSDSWTTAFKLQNPGVYVLAILGASSEDDAGTAICETRIYVRPALADRDRLALYLSSTVWGRASVVRSDAGMRTVAVGLSHVGTRVGLSATLGIASIEEADSRTFLDLEFQQRGNKGFLGVGASFWDLDGERRLGIVTDGFLRFPSLGGHALYLALQARSVLEHDPEPIGLQIGIGLRFDLTH